MDNFDSSVTATFLQQIFAGRTKDHVHVVSMYDPDPRKFSAGYDSSHLPCFIPESKRTVDKKTGLPSSAHKKLPPYRILHQLVAAPINNSLIESAVSKLPQTYRGWCLTLFTTDSSGNRAGVNTIDPLAIVAEYDHGVEAPSDVRLGELGLPLPTVRAKSGGGVHLWWFLLEDSCTKDQRHDVIVVIAEVTGADSAMKDEARVLRLPGSIHYKNPVDPKIVTILEANYNRRYTYADFAEFTSKHKQTVEATKKPRLSSTKNITATNNKLKLKPSPTKNTSDFIPPVPIERCLSKQHRAALSDGVSEGNRDNTGCSLARDLIGVANHVPSIQFDYKSKEYQLEVDGDAEQLLWDYCQRCSPPLTRADCDRIYKSALAFHPAPSNDLESLHNCLRSWTKENISSQDGTQLDREETAEKYQAIARKLGFNLSDKGLGKDGCPNSKMLKLKIDLFELFGERLKFNEMTREIELDNRPINLDLAKDFVATNLEYDAPTENCIIALTAIALKFKYHPVKDYLDSLRGKPVELNSITNFPEKYWGNNDPLENQLFFRKLLAAVGRVLNPGLKDDSLLVLQGRQGCGKSTLLRALAGDDWFNDDLRSLEDKDEIAKLSRFWIMELAEVDYLFGKKEVELFKRFLSGTEDTFRVPYGRGNATTKRTCCLFATTNKSEFLTDPTGDRRYWVVQVNTDVDIEAIKRDRDLIWATALAVFERGDQCHLTNEEKEAHAVANINWRDDSDPWNAHILKQLSTVVKRNASIEYVDIPTILDVVLHIPPQLQDKRYSNRVANCLKTAGFERRTLRLENKPTKVWLRDIPKGPVKRNPSNPSFKRWVTPEISPLCDCAASNPCNPSFKDQMKKEKNENGEAERMGVELVEDKMQKKQMQESLEKMGYLRHMGNESPEAAPGNVPVCNPSQEKDGLQKKMGYIFEMGDEGAEKKQMGSTLFPEPQSSKNGQSNHITLDVQPKGLSNPFGKFKIGDLVEYVGSDTVLQNQCAGVLKIYEVHANDGKYTCMKPCETSLTSRIDAEDLRLIKIK